ncbi:MAGa7180 family putative nuclease [Mycoplasmopsis lipophila]|uniref:MAGa7180 family putative nuclease n=1 Tax=Mycoplasmopsis lipophila TaxID=2117 RepID=UPI003872B3C8
MAAKRKYYNGVHYFLDEKSQVLKLTSEFHNKLLNKKLEYGKGFKKFGGSSIADVLETDSFKSNFGAFCHMCNLKMPVLVAKYVKAGIAIEPKIFDLMKKNFPNKVIEHLEAKDYNYDYFRGKYEFIQGVPDGIMPNDKVVLEMKTVNEKKAEIWGKPGKDVLSVPLDYRKQAQLYAYLLGYDRYSIVAAFIKEEDYTKPDECNLENRIIRQYVYKVDKNIVEDDIKRTIDFYKKYSVLGISPQYDPIRDRDQVEFLKCHNEQEWKELIAKWKTLGKVDLDYEE